jgi:hypothetical protein
MKIFPMLIRKANIGFASLLVLLLVVGVLGSATYVLASATSQFSQVINPGTLSFDIVDGSYVSVSSPGITMSAKNFSFSCQSGAASSTGTFGTASQQIYVSNPDAADNGWTATLAASSTTDVWTSGSTYFDFNDPGTSGCVDDGATTDADAYGGQMTVSPTGGTIAQGSSGNGTTGVSLGSAGSYVQGTTNSVTLMQSNGTTDIGDWTLQGVSVGQTIPAEQPANTYSIYMKLTATAT